MPLLRLDDSTGVKLNQYGIEKLSEDIQDFMNEKLKSGIPEEFVHCIWYCITGTRFEDIEINILKKLNFIYKSNFIPIIIVYTQAL